MKAARIHAHGDISQFKYEDAPDPTPQSGEVLIKVAAVSLNPVDMLVRQGWMKEHFRIPLPAILGVDVAGTVAAVGEGVTDPAPGDRVIGKLPINGKGSMAELVLARPEHLAKLPDNVAFTTGATLPMAALTGRQAVQALGVKSGDRVLVTGALGAVGRASVQYLAELGAVPIAVVRRDRLEEARAVVGEVLEVDEDGATERFAAAVDTTGGATGALAAGLVRDGGILATAAAVQTLPDGVDSDKRIRIVRIVNRDDSAMLQQIAEAVGCGDLNIPVARIFSLSEVAEANSLLAAGHVGGKIVLVP